jgi:Flp pilus assembly protein TadB
MNDNDDLIKDFIGKAGITVITFIFYALWLIAIVITLFNGEFLLAFLLFVVMGVFQSFLTLLGVFILTVALSPIIYLYNKIEKNTNKEPDE